MLRIPAAAELPFLHSYFAPDKTDAPDPGANYPNFTAKKTKKCFRMTILHVPEQFSNFMPFGIVFLI
jgi:hypothetical protein